MTGYDIIIKDGLIFDGMQTPRHRGDVGVKDGIITSIGRLRASDADRVIDAGGLHVAPGFVDVHTHYDAQVFWDPYLSISGWHGITTVLAGNCGFGFAPVAPEQREQAMLSMVRAEAIGLECMENALPWDWVTFPEFLDSLARAPKAINVRCFLPTSPLMIWVLGYERAKAGAMPSDDEHKELRRLMDEAMVAGAAGFSARLFRLGSRDFDGTPIAGDSMHEETIFELADVLSTHTSGCIQYLYSAATADDVDNSRPFQEVRELRRPEIQAHLEKLATVSGHPLMVGGLAVADEPWLQRCRERGLGIYRQGTLAPLPGRFLLSFEDEGTLTDNAPAWRETTIGPRESRLARLADPAHRQRMVDQAHLLETIIGRVEDWEIAQTYTPETAKYQGSTLREISDLAGNENTVEILADILAKDDLKTKLRVPTAILTNPEQDPRYVRGLVDRGDALPGTSDGGAHTKFLTSGSYTTDHIARLVREYSWATLEHMHWLLSAFPAYCIGLKNRGVIAEGAAADIIVYDYEKLQALPEEIVHDLPGGDWRVIRRARGYRNVVVNGRVTIEDDNETGDLSAGALLRNAAVSGANPATV